MLERGSAGPSAPASRPVPPALRLPDSVRGTIRASPARRGSRFRRARVRAPPARRSPTRTSCAASSCSAHISQARRPAGSGSRPPRAETAHADDTEIAQPRRPFFVVQPASEDQRQRDDAELRDVGAVIEPRQPRRSRHRDAQFPPVALLREAQLLERRSEHVLDDDQARAGRDDQALGADRAVRDVGHVLVQHRDCRHQLAQQAERGVDVERDVGRLGEAQDLGQPRAGGDVGDERQRRRRDPSGVRRCARGRSSAWLKAARWLTRSRSANSNDGTAVSSPRRQSISTVSLRARSTARRRVPRPSSNVTGAGVDADASAGSMAARDAETVPFGYTQSQAVFTRSRKRDYRSGTQTRIWSYRYGRAGRKTERRICALLHGAVHRVSHRPSARGRAARRPGLDYGYESTDDEMERRTDRVRRGGIRPRPGGSRARYADAAADGRAVRADRDQRGSLEAVGRRSPGAGEAGRGVEDRRRPVPAPGLGGQRGDAARIWRAISRPKGARACTTS